MEQAEAIDVDEIASWLARDFREVVDRRVVVSADRVALVEDDSSWTYRDLDRLIAEVVAGLGLIGIRVGDRLIIVSESCVALTGLLAAAVVSSHAGVVGSGVVGCFVNGNEEEVVDFAQLLQSSSLRAGGLKAFINAQLTSYKRPSVTIMVHTLPVMATGKIWKGHPRLVTARRDRDGNKPVGTGASALDFS